MWRTKNSTIGKNEETKKKKKKKRMDNELKRRLMIKEER